MRWELDPEQRMLEESLVGWLRRAAAPAAVRGWLDDGDPAGFESALADEGWLALGTAENRGGQGGGLLELALVAEQLARVCAPSSGWLATVLALPALDDEAAADLIERGALAALVVAADRPVGAAAVRVDGTGALTGEVPLVLGADRAEVLVVPADGALHLVRSDAPGVTVTPTALLDRSRTAATVRFDEAAAVRLAADAAATLADAALRSAVLVSADALGTAGRMLQLTVEYGGQRTQFGVPIGSFQAVKHAAAVMLVGDEASRSITYYAAASVDAALPDAPVHAAVAKAQVSRAAREAAESALTLHGAIGYTWEYDLQLFYKRAKLDADLYGAVSVWNERIADSLDLVPVSP